MTLTIQEQNSEVDIVSKRRVPEKLRTILFYFLDFGTIGGIERYIQTVAGSLSERGNFRPVVACCENTPFFYQLKALGIEVHGIPEATFVPAKFRKYYMKPLMRLVDGHVFNHLDRILNEVKPDIVHVQRGRIENSWFKRKGYPVVYTFHGYGAPFNPDDAGHDLERFCVNLTKPLFKWQVPDLDALLFVSQAEQQRMKRQGFLPKNYTGEVLYNGLPIDALQAQAADTATLKAALGIPANSLVVSYVNRIDKFKNPLAFIDFASLLADLPELQSLPPVHFLVAGSGHLEDAMQAAIQDTGLQDCFHVLGHRNDVAALYGISNLALFTPKTEGFGLSVLEAMACGTPLLAYRVGGIPELLGVPPLDSLLVESDNLGQLVQQAQRILMMTPVEQSKLKQALQDRAQAFDLSHMITRLESVYDRVLAH